MLKACKYCGRIHPSGYVCPKKPVRGRPRNSAADKFRSSWAWQKKRDDIVKRDYHLCRVCDEGSHGASEVATPGRETSLQVHHIEPLEERFDLRLEDSNLITVCSHHHELAERGDIPRAYLHGLAVTSPRWRGLNSSMPRQDQQLASEQDEF